MQISSLQKKSCNFMLASSLISGFDWFEPNITQTPKRGLALILRFMQLTVWCGAEKRRGSEEGVYQSSCDEIKWDDSAL